MQTTPNKWLYLRGYLISSSVQKRKGYNGDQLQAGSLAPGLGYIKDATYYDNCFDAAEAGYSDLMIQ